MSLEQIPLAHSARQGKSIPAQPYSEHVSNVTTAAVENATRAAKFSQNHGALLVAAVRLATEFHDLGKLDPENQHVLRDHPNESLRLNHVDAGVAHLLSQDVEQFDQQLAALLIYSHHMGLPSATHESTRQQNCLRDCGPGPDGRPLRQLTDERIRSYLSTHTAFVSGLPALCPAKPVESMSSLLCRIALSCLVDADHSDTARHYGKFYSSAEQPLRFGERLVSLDAYVANLSRGKNDERNRLRQAIYKECRRADPKPSLWECDSPVGTGKTTAVMAHLLHAANVKGLRRIFVVLPYTNIIDQSVGTYRRSLVLPSEDPEAVVAAHHHKADYEKLPSRHLAALWRAPIIVTTAVQFFETLASCSTGGLRKLHELIGSGVFIDESHACLPAKLWPQAWVWLREAVSNWGCHVVLGSGSLNRIWTLPGIASPTQVLPPLVTSLVGTKAATAEKLRVSLQSCNKPVTLGGLVDWLGGFNELPGPRLVIVNTVQIAAALAESLSISQGRDSVIHLSTALTPHHRMITLALVRSRLAYGTDPNWTLVATSCVEAGVELSFRTGLRQRASLASLLQTAGRVSRHAEYDHAVVWDFEMIPGGLVNEHPDLRDAAQVLKTMFGEGKVAPEFCTEALRREVLCNRQAELNEQLRKAEQRRDFPEVEQRFRVIDQDTVTAIVSRQLLDKLKSREPVDWRELQEHSVQIYRDKASKLDLPEAPGLPDVFRWNLPYNDFLGYMAGVLPLVKSGSMTGGYIV